MIGIILAAGTGSRFNGNGKKCCKVTKEIGGIPLITYSMDALAALKADRIYIVVGEYAKEISCVAADTYKGIDITYVMQDKQIGLANALMCAAEAAGKQDDVVLLLADEIFTEMNYGLIRGAMRDTKYDFFCGYTFENDIEKIKKNYSLELNGSDLIRCTEKPDDVINKMKGSGFYFFKSVAVKALSEIYKARSNVTDDLCDCMKHLLSLGMKGTAVCVASKEFNINTMSDLIEAENYLKA